MRAATTISQSVTFFSEQTLRKIRVILMSGLASFFLYFADILVHKPFELDPLT